LLLVTLKHLLVNSIPFITLVLHIIPMSLLMSLFLGVALLRNI
jgi:hypothetical protein